MTRRMLIPIVQQKPRLPTHKVVRKFWPRGVCEPLLRFVEPIYTRKMQDGKPIEIAELHPAGHPAFEELLQQLAANAVAMNIWGVHLTNISRPIQVIRYTPGSRSRLHVDFMAHRKEYDKLAQVVMLTPRSSFTGGRLIMDDKPVEPFNQGDLVSFPGYVMHGAEPVESGVRVILVCWVSGPAFV